MKKTVDAEIIMFDLLVTYMVAIVIFLMLSELVESERNKDLMVRGAIFFVAATFFSFATVCLYEFYETLEYPCFPASILFYFLAIVCFIGAFEGEEKVSGGISEW